jgi:RsiW-degrading membrane proteinase PrsW (M82 family)
VNDLVARVLVGLLPVVVFLFALVYLDSYKLIPLRRVVVAIVLGGLVAGVSYVVNVALLATVSIEQAAYSRYLAPLVEELAKALFLVYMIRANRIGFLVDAAIYGFAIGTGFALVENVYYLNTLVDAPFAVWVVRGAGTAIMHGGATAIFGIVAKALSERRGMPRFVSHLPGFALAWLVHSVFNHFFLSPVLSTLGVLIVLPPLCFAVFSRSEKSLSDWLNVGFDTDTELLELINSGELATSHVGVYLNSLRGRFEGVVLADLLCYLRIRTELALRAKGLLLMIESGFAVKLDDETRSKFEELRYLEKSIGKTGKLALAPLLHVSGKELWQLYMLENQAAP